MKVLITGSEGFIGKNLVVKLQELQEYEIVHFDEKSLIEDLRKEIVDIECIFHLAGVNRPQNPDEFAAGNTDFTRKLCDLIIDSECKIPIIFSSSIQAEIDNPYGISKLESEQVLLDYSMKTNVPVYIYRLPNVFGKWCRPNYNSVVATFCYNIANDLPIQVNDPDALINLVFIDDVISSFIGICRQMSKETYCKVDPVYSITIGELAEQIKSFKENRKTLVIGDVGDGLVRALYSTYVSYLKPQQFSYNLSKHEDPRGIFVEVLKTQKSGQVSFFTALPGITRGGHYHHTKTEKFLVLKGRARFCFRNILTDEKYTYCVSGDVPEIVETVPGWAHDITNIGDDEMIVWIWANEIFDKQLPDTIASTVT
ncbi:MAG: NAD-dependent epimerase/dehydratase family protein [Gammaproteobacteria bacterium]|nr:NAD-dependent epimerase/dehydratase family protein [Gammaproteobacteria bacterium]